MILIGGDIAKIHHEIVAVVENVEKKEGMIATVTLQTIHRNIWQCGVEFATEDKTRVGFTCLSMVKSNRQETLISCMQDGIVDWFDVTDHWLDHAYRHPDMECIEDFTAEMLFDLFVRGWDYESECAGWTGKPGQPGHNDEVP